MLLREIMLLFRPRLWRVGPFLQQHNTTVMLKTHVKIAFRNYGRNRGAFAINLGSLTLGLTVVLLILLWIDDERKYDRYHERANRMYRVMTHFDQGKNVTTVWASTGLLAPVLEEKVPGVQAAIPETVPSWTGEAALGREGSFVKALGKFSGKAFFEVFTHPLIEGNPQTVLSDPESIVLSRSLARRMFGALPDALGERVTWQLFGQTMDFTVTGIMEDVPQQTTEPFDFVVPFAYYENNLVTARNWNNYYCAMTVLLEPGAEYEAVQSQVGPIMDDYLESADLQLELVPYARQYLYNNFENGKEAGGRIEYVRLFALIAAFILVLACINFMNLATARASRRMREVGVMKTMGATQGSLVVQYLVESVLLSTLSMILSLLLAQALLPVFNTLTGKALWLGFQPLGMAFLLGIVLVTGILAGSYPAFFLSRMNILTILKGKLAPGAGSVWLRKGLVVFQFAMSVVLMVAVMVVYQQVQLVQSQHLGYTKDHVIYWDKEGTLVDSYAAYFGEIKQIPGVEATATANFEVNSKNFTQGLNWEGKGEEDAYFFNQVFITPGQEEVLEWDLASGRFLGPDEGGQENKMLLNEAAVEAMGLSDPLGTVVDHYSGPHEIVGVVKNFYSGSVYEAVKPQLFLYRPDQARYVMIRLKGGREAETLESLRKHYEAFNPGYPFDYQFLDADFAVTFQSEQRIGVLARYFAGFALLISCLGLLGLATFSAEQRHKEIGIRKVLGAGQRRIILNLSSEFTRLVLVALVLGLPVSYWLAEQWLAGFTARIALGWGTFLFAGGITLLIAWVTIGWKTFTASRVNPIEALKDE